MVHHANYQLHYHSLTWGVNDAFLLCRSNSLSLHSHTGGCGGVGVSHRTAMQLEVKHCKRQWEL